MSKFGEQECGVCKEQFVKTCKRQLFCSPFCRAKHVQEERIRKWVEKVPRKQDPNLGDRMEAAALYNRTGGWMRKFVALRG